MCRPVVPAVAGTGKWHRAAPNTGIYTATLCGTPLNLGNPIVGGGCSIDSDDFCKRCRRAIAATRQREWDTAKTVTV